MNAQRKCGYGQGYLDLVGPHEQYAGMWSDWWMIPVSILATVVVIWLLLVAALWLAKPRDLRIEDFARLLPDLVLLLKGIATDPQTPRRLRIGLVATLAFIASPIDLIPDIIPVLGMADDVLLIALVLRWVIRTAGMAALTKHWPGNPDGLSALCRLFGVTKPL